MIKKIPASLRQNLLGSGFSAHRPYGLEGAKAAPLPAAEFGTRKQE